jgi:hypothetical protein
MTLDLDDLESKAKAATPGPWTVFVCDDGKQWTGWPLCISATNVLNSNGDERVIVRTGGFYPYEWDHGTSQDEANANAAHIASANPETMLALIALIRRLQAENEASRQNTSWMFAEKLAELSRLRAEKVKLVEALKPLVDAAHGLSFGTDWNNGTHAKLHGHRQKLIDAVPRARAAIEEVNRE